ncbi:hypothetical protein [Teichococcus cervicalis]|uniref:TIGR02301 family protein n=1 Tax=Pseudoroseomonas cervicalis ATCC 49957 TaxID=525371 RepID=D5RS56_9PROT|nr:hypothetical protein [Pseudoroseomonas cervicalis]EFH09862.1 hypothetical protein HMPREF0731_3918 [Pseudoroseomonas cervicalis ATCC 49957]
MAYIQRFLAGSALALAVALPAAAQTCLQPAEHAAMAVRALQSQLMVAALSCNQHDDYNAFVTRHQRDLGTAWRNLTGHFRRVHGGRAQREMDGYITTLANAQSQEGIRQGSHFCQNVAPLFQQALSQSGMAALASLSLEQKVLNPYGAEACPAPATRSAQATPRRSTPDQPAPQTQVAIR